MNISSLLHTIGKSTLDKVVPALAGAAILAGASWAYQYFFPFQTQQPEEVNATVAAYARVDGAIRQYQTALDKVDSLRGSLWIDKLSKSHNAQDEMARIRQGLPAQADAIQAVINENRLTLGAQFPTMLLQRVGFLNMRENFRQDLYEAKGDEMKRMLAEGLAAVNEEITARTLSKKQVQRLALRQARS